MWKHSLFGFCPLPIVLFQRMNDGQSKNNESFKLLEKKNKPKPMAIYSTILKEAVNIQTHSYG